MGVKNPTFTNVSLRFYGGKGGIMDEDGVHLFKVTQQTNRPNNHKRPGEKIKMQNKKEPNSEFQTQSAQVNAKDLEPKRTTCPSQYNL